LPKHGKIDIESSGAHAGGKAESTGLYPGQWLA
jgi:hypothetical protein